MTQSPDHSPDQGTATGQVQRPVDWVRLVCLGLLVLIVLSAPRLLFDLNLIRNMERDVGVASILSEPIILPYSFEFVAAGLLIQILWPWLMRWMGRPEMPAERQFAKIFNIAAGTVIVFSNVIVFVPGVMRFVLGSMPSDGFDNDFFIKLQILLFLAYALFLVRAFHLLLVNVFGRGERRETDNTHADERTMRRREIEAKLARMPEERRWLTLQLYERSDQMRTRANVILAAINVLIVGGLISIYLAGDLVSSDAQTITPLAQVTQMIDDYEASLATIDQELERVSGAQELLVVRAHAIRKNIYGLTGEQSPSLVDIVRSDSGSVVDLSGFEGLPMDPDKTALLDRLVQSREGLVEDYFGYAQNAVSLAERRTGIAKTLEMLEERLATDIQSFLTGAETVPADRALLIASGVTRFGILLVVIFLVQILVGVYRYSLRLSAFYAGRADALIAGLDRKSDLGPWGDNFLPGDIDFGRQPSTPAQYVVDAIDAYMKKEKRTSD